MEQYISPELLTSSNSKQQAQQQQQQLQAAAAFDFFSFSSSPSDVLAPHPDLFESELDSSLAGFDSLNLSFLTVDPTDAYALLRAETPTCGPPSTITVSSESASAYESLSSQSEAYYNYASSQFSFPIELEMFNRVNINAREEYLTASRAQNTATGLSVDAVSERSYGAAEQSPSSSGFSSAYEEQDTNAYGTLPPSPPERHTGSVYSDYTGSDYYLAPAASSHHPSLYGATVAPTSIAVHQQTMHQPQARAPSPVGAGLAMQLLPRISRSDTRGATRGMPGGQLPGQPSGHSRAESLDDPRKRYQCDRCPKAFARAYNLKTHMETHNPNRLKAFICPYSQCKRQFSRKHDLGRHVVSIHRTDPRPGSSADVSDDGTESLIGVSALKEGRHRCDNCGKSGPTKNCSCVDVK